MCIAFPGLVVGLEPGNAVVEVDGRRRRASLLRCPATAIGDWVLVGAGTVLRAIDADEAASLAQTLKAAMAATDVAAAAMTPGGTR